MQPESEQVNDVTFTLYCDLDKGEPLLLEIETDHRNRVTTKKVAQKDPIDVEGGKCKTGTAHLKKVGKAQFHLIVRDTANTGVPIESWGIAFTPSKDTRSASPFGDAAEGGEASPVPRASYTEYELRPTKELVFTNPGWWRYGLRLNLPTREPLDIDPEMEVTL